MGSYLDSPQYQAMMAQVLRGSQRGSQYPAEAGANAIATMLQAYSAKKFGQQEQTKEDARGKAYADAFAPVTDPALLAQQVDTQTPGTLENQAGHTAAPDRSQIMAKLLANPDVANQLGPQLAAQTLQQHPVQIDPSGKAYDPYNTPVGTQFADPRVKPQAVVDQEKDLKAAPGPAEQPKPQSVVDQEMALKAAPGAPTPGMSPEAFNQQKQLAQIKADIAAQVQGEFGRSLQGKSYNILAAGLKDPSVRSTPEYATAWQILSNPRVDPNTGTIVTPDLSAFAPPTGGQSTPAPGQPPQAAPSGAPGAPPAQRMPSVQSFAPPNPSQPEAASAGYANRLSESSGIIDKTQGSGTSLINRGAASLPGGNYLVGSDYQQLDQAERNFVNAQLRRESGAAISESEFQNARKQYFPQPGDKPEVLAQKKKARDMAVQNMQLSAGNVLLPPGVVQQSSPPKGAPMVPQQQGFGATAPAASGGWKIERVQ